MLSNPDRRTRMAIRNLDPKNVTNIKLAGFEVLGTKPEWNEHIVEDRQQIAELVSSFRSLPLAVGQAEDRVNSIEVVLVNGGVLSIGFGGCSRFSYFGRDGGRAIEKYLNPDAIANCPSPSG